MKFDLAKRITTLVLAVMLGPAVNFLSAQTFTILHTFGSVKDDGEDPEANLILVKGVLYGTTASGGTHHNGTVFKMTTAGVETILYSMGTNTVDGQSPEGELFRDSAGNLYGTTASGGTTGTKGTSFKVTGKKEKLLHSFLDIPDGSEPQSANMVMDSAGNLYGTTSKGGKGNCGFNHGCGTVFKISTTGKESIIHSFQNNGKDGIGPYGGLIIDSANNLYGVANGGGANNNGITFKMTTVGKEKILHAFKQPEGQGLVSKPVMDSAGNLYGTSISGGSAGKGTVYKMSPTGKVTVLYSFTGLTDGGEPWGSVALDPKGNVYGITSIGGGGSCSTGCGVIFKVTPTGKETVLYTLNGTTDGFYSRAGLIRDPKGNLYGSTFYGGTGGCNCGTIFKLAPK